MEEVAAEEWISSFWLRGSPDQGTIGSDAILQGLFVVVVGKS